MVSSVTFGAEDRDMMDHIVTEMRDRVLSEGGYTEEDSEVLDRLGVLTSYLSSGKVVCRIEAAP